MPALSTILSPFPPNPMVQNAVQLPRLVQESGPVLDEIVRLGPGPVSRWQLIEALEPDHGGDRRHLRDRRAEVFRKIDDLVRCGKLVKLGRYGLSAPDARAASTAAAADNGYNPRWSAGPRRGTREAHPRKRTVRAAIAHHDCRAPERPRPGPEVIPGNKIILNCLAVQPPQLEPPKPSPSPEAISEAARALGKRRGFRKLWSGYVNGERIWRGREIQLPDGERAYAYGALRGMVVWSFDPARLPGGDGEPLGWGVLPQERVRLAKNTAAQLLGRQRRGIRERKSEQKAAAVRINGRMPPRPGSRPRGRPKGKPTATGPTASASIPIK